LLLAIVRRMGVDTRVKPGHDEILFSTPAE